MDLETARANVQRATLADNDVAAEQRAARDALIAALAGAPRGPLGRLLRFLGIPRTPKETEARRHLEEVDRRRAASLAACDVAEDELAQLDPAAAAARPGWRSVQEQWKAADRVKWAVRMKGAG